MQKKKIQLTFQEKMGLIVDRPKASGSGTSNDGNTSRRAFQNEQLFSEITGLNFEIIKVFHVVLTCISFGFELDRNTVHLQLGFMWNAIHAIICRRAFTKC